MKEVFIKSFDKLNISLAIYETKNPKAIVQVVHGMCEHKERYDYLARKLQKKGYIVVLSDNRGHGKSVKEDSDFGYFKDSNGTKALIEDQKKINNYIKKLYPKLPVYMFSHSMGTLIARNYIKKYDDTINKLIMSGAPCYNSAAKLGVIIAMLIKKVKGPKEKSNLLVSLAAIAMEDKGKNVDKDAWLSYNVDNRIKYRSDPLSQFKFSTAGYQTLFEMTRDLHKYKEYKLKNKDLEILFLSGEDDNVIGGEKGLKDSINTLYKVGYKNINNIIYSHMRHEILHEDEKDNVIKDIIKFYNS